MSDIPGSINPELFNEQYYRENRDRTPAGVEAYKTVTDGVYMEQTRDMARTFKKRWPWIRKVLVLGCGRGYMVKAFKELGLKVTGVDYSKYALAHLVEGVDRSDVVFGDIVNLSFAGRHEYDLVLALDVFNCIKPPGLFNAISEATRVGKMIVVDTPVNPDDIHPDMSSIHGNYDVSIYSRTWWVAKFLEYGAEYYQGQEYTYPDHVEGSRWEDGKTHCYTMYYRTPHGFPSAKHPARYKVMDGGEDFRIVWWGNGPWTPTGYGVGTEQVVFKAAEHYNVAVLCNYGLEGRAIRMGSQDGRYKTSPIMYPKLFEPSGGDAAQLVCQNWKPDAVVTLFDVWVGEGKNAYTPREPGWLKAMLPYWIAWTPVDHDPVPGAVLNQCRLADRVVAMSRFGQHQLDEHGIGAEFIPHGVYTDVFKPTEDKSAAVENLITRGAPMDMDNSVEWSNEDFVIGVNAANKDTKRKGFEETFKAINHFLVNNPDARKDTRLYLHTWQDFPGGMPLYGLARTQSVDPYTRVSHKWYMYCGLNMERMAELYQGFDIFMNISRNEGFGIPIIEAMSSGVPVIATDFTSMTELVQGVGWLVKPVTHVTDMLMSLTAVPNFYEAAEYIEKAYNSPDTVRKLGEKARRRVVNRYDVEKVVQPLWMSLFEDVRKELEIRRPKPVDEEWIM